MVDYTTNMDLRWLCDEGSGNAYDEVSNVSGTLTGAGVIWVVDATKGNSINTHQIETEYIDGGSMSSYNWQNNFTVTGWYRNLSANGLHAMFDIDTSCGVGNLWAETNFRLWGRGGNTNDMGLAVPADSSWHFVAVTYSSTTGVTLYLDGSATNVNWANNTANSASSGNLKIGKTWGAQYDWSDQYTHDFRHYNAVLSTTNIQDIYDAGANQSSFPVAITTTSNFNYGPQITSFYANGRHWIIYSDGTDAKFRTSTDGISWSTATAFRTTCTRGDYISVWFDGTYVHYAYGTTGTSIYYRRGTTASNGTISWSAAEQTVTVSSSGNLNVSICVDSSGYACIGFTSINNYPAVVYNANNDGTWSTAASYPLELRATDSDVSWQTGFTLVNGRPYCAYARNYNPIKGRLHTSGSTWVAEESVSAAVNCIYGELGWDIGADGSNYVYVVFNSYSPYRIYVASRNPAGGAWTQSSSLGDGDYQYEPAINVLTDGTLYVFVPNSPDTRYINLKKRVGGSWDANWSHWDTNSNTLQDYGSLSTYSCSENEIGLCYLIGAASPYSVYFKFEAPAATTTTFYTGFLRFT
jgi:hypothetical protein